MAINKKPSMLAAEEFRNHVDQISKAALIDLTWDLLMRMHGEEATFGNGIVQFEDAFEPVAGIRGDKMPKRRAAIAKATVGDPA